MKDVDSRVFTGMLRKDGRTVALLYHFADNKFRQRNNICFHIKCLWIVHSDVYVSIRVSLTLICMYIDLDILYLNFRLPEIN